jgi:hypothetical protein
MGSVAGGGIAEGLDAGVGWTVALGTIEVRVGGGVARGAIEVRMARGVGVRGLAQPIMRHRIRKRSGLFFGFMIGKVLSVCSK